MKSGQIMFAAGLAALLLAVVFWGASPQPVAAVVNAHILDNDPALTIFVGDTLQIHRIANDIAIHMEAVLPSGALGLPGEPVSWIITVTNTGQVALNDVVVTDTLRDELRIDRASITHGDYAISAQVVVFTLETLEPREMAQMRIDTTVLRSPLSGILTNQAQLVAGDLTRSAGAEVYIPTGLPATGYPPESDFPGEGEPSVFVVALMAFSMVALTACFVWYRGSKL